MTDTVTPQELAAAFRRLNRRSKYGAKKASVQGQTFDSQREAGRYVELTLLEKAGVITNLQRQVAFRLTAHGQPICCYVCDFTYIEQGELVVEDAKGFATAVYKLKKKLFEAEFKRVIREV